MLDNHLMLFYEAPEKLNLQVAKFINEGLRNDELCVIYDEIGHKKQQIDDLLLLIENYEEYLKSKQLLLVDFSNDGSSTANYLDHFEIFKKQIQEILEKRKIKIRCVGSLANCLFHNEKFKECFNVEDWWDANQDRIMILCLYFYSPVIKSKFEGQFHNVARKHSHAIDTENNLISEFTYR